MSQVYVKSRLNSPWKSSFELGLDGSFVEEWNGYVLALNGVGICLSYHQDTIVWDWEKSVKFWRKVLIIIFFLFSFLFRIDGGRTNFGNGRYLQN